MDRRPITIRDIAKKLNISVSTVSRALRDNPEISIHTRKKVKEIAKELRYRPNPIAVALRTKKSKTLGVIVPEIVSTFYATVVKGIEQVADKHGYHVFVSSSSEDFEKERKSVDAFLDNQIDGIILSLARSTETFMHIEKIKNQEVPLVLFDRTAKDINVSKVVTDDAKAAYKAVTHLIKGGAKRIALITESEHLMIGRNRMRGYKQALEDNNLTINEDFIIRRSNFSLINDREEIKRLLTLPNRPDAFFCINDDLAIGSMYAVKEVGLRIPRDVAIVGFYNSKRSRYMKPSLSTMELNPHEIGVLSAGLLFEQLYNKEIFEVKKLVVPSNLIVRESSRK